MERICASPQGAAEVQLAQSFQNGTDDDALLAFERVTRAVRVLRQVMREARILLDDMDDAADCALLRSGVAALNHDQLRYARDGVLAHVYTAAGVANVVNTRSTHDTAAMGSVAQSIAAAQGAILPAVQPNVALTVLLHGIPVIFDGYQADVWFDDALIQEAAITRHFHNIKRSQFDLCTPTALVYLRSNSIDTLLRSLANASDCVLVKSTLTCASKYASSHCVDGWLLAASLLRVWRDVGTRTALTSKSFTDAVHAQFHDEHAIQRWSVIRDNLLRLKPMLSSVQRADAFIRLLHKDDVACNTSITNKIRALIVGSSAIETRVTALANEDAKAAQLGIIWHTFIVTSTTAAALTRQVSQAPAVRTSSSTKKGLRKHKAEKAAQSYAMKKANKKAKRILAPPLDSESDTDDEVAGTDIAKCANALRVGLTASFVYSSAMNLVLRNINAPVPTLIDVSATATMQSVIIGAVVTAADMVHFSSTHNVVLASTIKLPPDTKIPLQQINFHGGAYTINVADMPTAAAVTAAAAAAAVINNHKDLVKADRVLHEAQACRADLHPAYVRLVGLRQLTECGIHHLVSSAMHYARRLYASCSCIAFMHRLHATTR